MSATHGTVVELVRRVEGLGHKLYMDSYFLSPALFDDLIGKKNKLLRNISSWAIKAKKGDIIMWVRGNQSIVHWKDKHDVYLLTNMHTSPVEGNFCDESSHAVTPHVIEDYNAHVGYVDKSDRMVNSYGIARRSGLRNSFST